MERNMEPSRRGARLRVWRIHQVIRSGKRRGEECFFNQSDPQIQSQRVLYLAAVVVVVVA